MKINVCPKEGTASQVLNISSIPGKAGRFVGLDTVGTFLPDVRIDLTAESNVTKAGVRRTMIKVECPYREYDETDNFKVGKQRLISGYIVLNTDYDTPIPSSAETESSSTRMAQNMALLAVVQCLAASLVPGINLVEHREKLGVGTYPTGDDFRGSNPFVLASYGIVPIADGMELGAVESGT